MGEIGMLGWYHLIALGVVLPVAAIFAQRRFHTLTSLPDRRFALIDIALFTSAIGVFSSITADAEGVAILVPEAPATADIFFAVASLFGAVGVVWWAVWRHQFKSLPAPRILYFCVATRPSERWLWVLVAATAGVFEEISWRGVQYALLARLFGNTPWAVAASVVSFALCHVVYGWKALPWILALGLGFHALVLLSGSLYTAIVVHFIYDLIAGIVLTHYAAKAGYECDVPMDPPQWKKLTWKAGFLTVMTILGISVSLLPTDRYRVASAELRFAHAAHKHRRDHAEAVGKYRPLVRGDINDIGIQAAELLNQLPGIASVEQAVVAPTVANRIIHLRDRPLVPRDKFGAELHRIHGKHISVAEFELAYLRHLHEVELVQIEQIAVLRCLVAHHGLTTVFVERHSEQLLWRVDELAAAHKDLQQQRKRLLELLADADHDDDMEDLQEALDQRMARHTQELLEVGAAHRLAISGVLKEIRSLSDSTLGEALSPDESVNKASKERRDAMVQKALSLPVAIIILDGSHDLSGHVQAVSPRIEYVRVTPASYPKE